MDARRIGYNNNGAVDAVLRGQANCERVAPIFGGAYGDDDLVLTPVGRLYGVEIHAGAYLQKGAHQVEAIDFLFDWGLAVLFAWFAIGDLWQRYFHARFDGGALKSAAAPLFILRLGVRVALALAFLMFLSMELFQEFGLWLSPLPLAIGMLFDSFVSASVEGAVHSHSQWGHGSLVGYNHPSSSSFKGAHPNVPPYPTFDGHEAHEGGMAGTAVAPKVIANQASASSRPSLTQPRSRTEPPVSEWIRSVWRMIRWLVYGWAALALISSIVM